MPSAVQFTVPEPQGLQDEFSSAGGILVYANAQGRLDEAIAAAGANGGKVIERQHQIGPHRFRAIIHDSEGNRVALHSTCGEIGPVAPGE